MVQLYRLLQVDTTIPPFRYDPRLARVARLVDDAYAEDLPLERAAAAACLEAGYFSKYFRREVGIGYREWLTRYRLCRACRLMCERRLSITSVAERSGFGAVRGFERATLRFAGCTPRELREQLRPAAGS